MSGSGHPIDDAPARSAEPSLAAAMQRDRERLAKIGARLYGADDLRAQPSAFSDAQRAEIVVMIAEGRQSAGAALLRNLDGLAEKNARLYAAGEPKAQPVLFSDAQRAEILAIIEQREDRVWSCSRTRRERLAALYAGGAISRANRNDRVCASTECVPVSNSAKAFDRNSSVSGTPVTSDRTTAWSAHISASALLAYVVPSSLMAFLRWLRAYGKGRRVEPSRQASALPAVDKHHAGVTLPPDCPPVEADPIAVDAARPLREQLAAAALGFVFLAFLGWLFLRLGA